MGKAALAVSLDQRLADPALTALFGSGAQGAARLAFWQAATGGQAAPDAALERQLAGDILQAMGQVPADRLLARRGSMLVRAASALRAAADGQGGHAGRLGHATAQGDVQIAARRLPHAGFFALEETDLTFRRFDGSQSPMITREVMVACDAVTVLPYDPVRDRVLLVEQLRAAPLTRGDPQPWLVEAVAGRVDPGETPQDAALREMREEAGVASARLVKAAEYYPSTGALSEYLYAFVALCDLPDGSAGLHGLAEEAEDIRGHLLALDDALQRMEAGEFTCGPLLFLLMWLRGARDGLRGARMAGGI